MLPRPRNPGRELTPRAPAQRPGASFVAHGDVPQPLQAAMHALVLDATAHRGERRTHRQARLRLERGAAQQLGQSRAGVGAIALLRTEPLRRDDQHAVAAQALAGDGLEPAAHVVVDAVGAIEIVMQLDRCRLFLHGLAAGTGSEDEILVDRAFIDGDGNLADALRRPHGYSLDSDAAGNPGGGTGSERSGNSALLHPPPRFSTNNTLAFKRLCNTLSAVWRSPSAVASAVTTLV